jgi:uncharacterized protein YfbU (UPF0304 family)
VLFLCQTKSGEIKLTRRAVSTDVTDATDESDWRVDTAVVDEVVAAFSALRTAIDEQGLAIVPTFEIWGHTNEPWGHLQKSEETKAKAETMASAFCKALHKALQDHVRVLVSWRGRRRVFASKPVRCARRVCCVASAPTSAEYAHCVCSTLWRGT